MKVANTLSRYFISAALLIPASFDAGASSITGYVIDYSRASLEGVQVSFMDAENARIMGSTITGTKGLFDSGPLPSGDYRLRFSTGPVSGAPMIEPTFYLTGEFSDSFCQAGVLSLAPDQHVEIAQTVRVSGPRENIFYQMTVEGTIVDEMTVAPLADIQVDALRADNGFPLASAVTDTSGWYGIYLKTPIAITVRLSDPTGFYLPEFYGAGDRDDFCLGTVIPANYKSGPFDGALRVAPAEALTEILISSIESLNLPDSVDAQLRTPLLRMTSLLSDGVPSNDVSVCKQFDSLVTRIDILENLGRLSTGEATDLRLKAGAARRAAAC